MNINYATLYEFKRYRGGGLLTSTTDDALIQKLLTWSTGVIHKVKGRRYDVRLATILHDAPIRESSAFGVYDRSRRLPTRERSLILREDLLEMVELKNGDGTVLASGEYFLSPSSTPYSVVRLSNGIAWLPDDNGNLAQAISVKGWWGYHDDYPNCFVDSLDTVIDNPLSAGSTTIKVSNVNGTASDLDSPRFQAGMLLRAGSELMYLVSATANDPADDELTVVRGVNGSTAASHAQGTKIEIFRPMSFVNQAAIRLTAWRYAQKDTDQFDKTYAAGSGITVVPTALPEDVRLLLGVSKVRP